MHLFLRLSVALTVFHLSLANTCTIVRFKTVEEYNSKKETSDGHKACSFKATWSGSCAEPMIELGSSGSISAKCGQLKSQNELHSVECTCTGDKCNDELENFDKLLSGLNEDTKVHCLRTHVSTLISKMKQERKQDRTLIIILGVSGGLLLLVLIGVIACCAWCFCMVKKGEKEADKDLKRLEEDGNAPVIVASEGKTYILYPNEKKSRTEKSKTEKSKKSSNKSHSSQKSNFSMSKSRDSSSQKSQKSSKGSQESQTAGVTSGASAVSQKTATKSTKSHTDTGNNTNKNSSMSKDPLSLSKDPLSLSRDPLSALKDPSIPKDTSKGKEESAESSQKEE